MSAQGAEQGAATETSTVTTEEWEARVRNLRLSLIARQAAWLHARDYRQENSLVAQAYQRALDDVAEFFGAEP